MRVNRAGAFSAGLAVALVVGSGTAVAKVKGLNADLLGGLPASAFLPARATATNASRLAGLGPAAYLNTVYAGASSGATALPTGPVDGVTVPAGSYLVTGYADFLNGVPASTADVGCALGYRVGEAAIVMGSYGDAVVTRYASISVPEMKTFVVPTTISLSCSAYSGNDDGSGRVMTSMVTAAPVQLPRPVLPSLRG